MRLEKLNPKEADINKW